MYQHILRTIASAAVTAVSKEILFRKDYLDKLSPIIDLMRPYLININFRYI